MAKDPICGMDVKEERALYFLHYEHEITYFCSNACKETYSQQSSMGKPTTKKGMFGRFLEKLAKQNKQNYGDTPPKCH